MDFKALDELLTTEEAASFLKCSEEHVARMRMQKRGPRYYKHGKIVRYSKADLCAWLASGAVEAA